MVERVFLGAGIPLLQALADDLLCIAGDGDLSRHLIVVPSSRAKRRLETLLIDRCSGPLTPPDIVTPGVVLDRMVIPRRSIASPMATSLAWLEAVAALSPHQRTVLTGDDRAFSSSQRHAMATRLARLTRELSSGDLKPRDVPDRLGDAAESDRWVVLGEVHDDMLARLDSLGLDDRDDAIQQSLQADNLWIGDLSVVSVIAADLPLRTRHLLELLVARDVRVRSMIHAKPDQAEAFGNDGRLDIDHWSVKSINISEDTITVCAQDDDQIAVAFEYLASMGEINAADACIVVPDEAQRERLMVAAATEEIPIDLYDGPPVSSGRIGTLLGLLANVADTKSADTVSSLVRHPDVEAWLVRSGCDNPVMVWDTCWTSLLPNQLDDLANFEFAHEEQRSLLAALLTIANRLNGTHTASYWPAVLLEILGDLLDGGDPSAGRTPTDRDESMWALHRHLTDLHEHGPDAPEIAGSEVLRLLATQLESDRIDVGERTGGVEAIGWLDAHLDDAKTIIVLGMNEGVIPGAATIDSWLTDRQRDLLGLPSHRSIAARDAFLLTAMLDSGRKVQLVCARTDNNRQPLPPSTLLLRIHGTELAMRVKRLTREGDSTAPQLADRRSSGGGESSFQHKPLPDGDPDITTISVTSFKTYLADPYTFLLQYDRRIRSREVQCGYELDAGGFGTLVHAALEEWGRREVEDAGPTTAKDIQEAMHAALDAVVASTHGDHPLPGVRLQIEMVRRRLDLFADIQAKRFDDGWRLHGVEWSFGRGKHDTHRPPQFPDADGLLLTGKIDRIDVHDTFGYQALDYKTSIAAEGPVTAHYTRNGWKDLQLPLYRVLLDSVGIVVPSSGLGYIQLGPVQDTCGIAMANWSDADLADAELVGADVVAQIVSGQLLRFAREKVS